MTCLVLAATLCAALVARFTAVPDHADARYACGETASVVLTARGTNDLPLTRGKLRVTVDNFGARNLADPRLVDLARENPFRVTTACERPGFARIRVTTAAPEELTIDGNPYWRRNNSDFTFALAYDAEKIQPGTPDADDFDAFWSDAVRTLDATQPVDARCEPCPAQSTGAFNAYRISVASCEGRRVWGWLVEPKDLTKGPYPVSVTISGAGIGYTGPANGETGRIVCNLNVHSYAQAEGTGAAADAERERLYRDQDARYAKPCGVARYCQAGIHRSREDYFYYPVILGLSRLIDYVATRPEVDARRISYTGTSQGGGLGLAMTYLNRHIARSVICVPALTDLLSSRCDERQSGWPQLIEAQLPENRAAAARNAPYFCGVNFARRIRKPIRFAVGFADNVCAPHAVYAAYNACPSADKAILCGLGMSHRVFGDYYDYLRAWQYDFAEPPSAQNGRYRFLAFNIWGDYFGNPTHERDATQAAIIRAWQPDFIGLQEVTENFWQSRLFTALQPDYAAVGRGLGCKPKSQNAFVPVLYRVSRFDLVDAGAEWFCPELDTSKGVVWAVLRDKATRRAILIFASHFWWQYKGDGDDWIRLYNAQRLRARVFAIAAKHHAAIIGGGDLNAPLRHAALQYLVTHGLADAQATADLSPRACPSEHGNPRRDPKGLYRGTPAIRGMCAVPEKYLYLDHIFYDPRTIHVTRFNLDISPDACRVSDHHPVVADFELKGNH